MTQNVPAHAHESQQIITIAAGRRHLINAYTVKLLVNPFMCRTKDLPPSYSPINRVMWHYHKFC